MEIQLKNKSNTKLILPELNLELESGEIVFVDVNENDLDNIKNTPILEIITGEENKNKKTKKKKGDYE